MKTNARKWSIRELTIKEVEAKSILRKHKKIDSWFLSSYGMNLYRGVVLTIVSIVMGVRKATTWKVNLVKMLQ